MTDDEGLILLWSRSAEALFGYTAGEMLQREAGSLFENWPPVSSEAVGRRKNGTTFPARVEIDSGERDLSLITVADLSRHDPSLGRAAATMAHEFNNVLMGIGTFIEVLKRKKSADAVERATHGIEGSLKRGRAVTDEILRYTRASQPVLATIDVAAWLADFTAEARAISSHATIRSESGLHIRADVSQLNQVLINLLLNARDASPLGTPVTITAAQSGAFVEIIVADRGAGPRGPGLGLAVAHQVVAAHGGSIRAESEIGAGTQFHLLLPAAQPSAGVLKVW